GRCSAGPRAGFGGGVGPPPVAAGAGGNGAGGGERQQFLGTLRKGVFSLAWRAATSGGLPRSGGSSWRKATLARPAPVGKRAGAWHGQGHGGSQERTRRAASPWRKRPAMPIWRPAIDPNAILPTSMPGSPVGAARTDAHSLNQPPAMAPMIRNGSAPAATGPG